MCVNACTICVHNYEYNVCCTCTEYRILNMSVCCVYVCCVCVLCECVVRVYVCVRAC